MGLCRSFRPHMVEWIVVPGKLTRPRPLRQPLLEVLESPLGGMSQHLIAKIRIDRADVDRFLEQPPFLGKGSTTSAWEIPQMAERGWDLDAIGSSISAQGIVDAAPEMCAVTISLDDPKAAVVYLYWQSQ